MTVALGVDIGGTGTRWCLLDGAGARIGAGTLAGATGLPDPALRARLAATLRALRAALPAAPGAAVLGLTGMGRAPDDDLVATCADALALPAARLWLMNDMELAGHAAFGPGARGHLVAAGTGSVALHKDAEGTMHLVGGHGTLIDDAGSGAWIGLRALRAVWRRIDEAGAPAGLEALAEQLFAALGGRDWEATRRAIYGGDRGAPAALAPAVAAAARAGDCTALALLTRAGHELGRLVEILERRFGPAPVAAIGGVFALHPAVAEGLRARLPGTPISFPSLDPAATAARLARAHFAQDPR